MEIIALLATLIGGIAALIQMYKWFKNHKENSELILKESGSTIIFSLLDSKDGKLQIDRGNLSTISKELIFQCRENNNVNIEFKNDNLNKTRKEFLRLKAKKVLTQEEIHQRNLLQKQFKNLDELFDLFKKIIIFVASNSEDSEFEDTLHGLIDRFEAKPTIDGTKIDVWIPEDSKFSTFIDLTKEEVNIILLNLNLTSQQDLAMGPHCFYVHDLPIEIINKKVKPAIAFQLYHLSKKQKIELNDLAEKLEMTGSWNIGLG